MTCPFIQFLTIQLGSDVPFLPVLYAATGFFLHGVLNGVTSPRPFFLAGLLAGAAMLIRPIGVGLPLLFGLVLWLVSRGQPFRLRMIFLAWLLLGSTVAVLPWETWLYLKTGRIIPLSDVGSPTLREGWTFGVQSGQPEGRKVFGEGVSDVMQEFATASNDGSLGAIFEILVRECRRHPAAVARLLFLKLVRCWYGTDSLRFEGPILIAQALYLPLLLLAGWRAWHTGPAGRVAVFCIGALIFYFWGMTFLVVPLLRYMTPVQGLAFVLLPAAIAWTRA
jgi:hypothetical protein